MQEPISDQITSGEEGVPLAIDTERTTLAGLTLELEFYEPDDYTTPLRTVTGADGGDGPVGKLITYTTDSDDLAAGVFAVGKEGEWRIVPRISGSGLLRRGTPPYRLMVVAKGG